jgi:DNA-binding SARP family transcriptional activator
MLTITMLGRMAISTPSKRIRLDLGESGRLLAGYLFTFPSRVHRREHLADMFWPERPPEKSRAALNTALWRIRKVLSVEPVRNAAEILCSTVSEVVLESAPWLQVDSHSFDSKIGPALTAIRSSPAAVHQVHEALNEYAGLFLDGDEADWIIAERERLHSLYTRGLCALIKTYAANDEFDLAIAAARRLLAADPFRETVMRWLALLLVLNGQRAQAISDLNRWQTALRQEIGIEPLPETKSLRLALASAEIANEARQLKRAYFGESPPAL